MSISLTPDQGRFVQNKLQANEYRSTAIAASNHRDLPDGETWVNGILKRFQQANQA